MSDEGSGSTVDLASNLTMAWLANPNTRANAEDATGFLANIHATLNSLSGGQPVAPSTSSDAVPGASEAAGPAVTVRKSLASRDHIISMIDGKPYTTLKRHIGSHGMTPAQYRERYGLKPDYPMVAPAYAEKRRALAKKIGLGSRTTRKGGTKAAATKAVPQKAAAPKRRGRPPKK